MLSIGLMLVASIQPALGQYCNVNWESVRLVASHSDSPRKVQFNETSAKKPKCRRKFGNIKLKKFERVVRKIAPCNGDKGEVQEWLRDIVYTVDLLTHLKWGWLRKQLGVGCFGS